MSIGRLLFKFGILYGLLLTAGGLVLAWFDAKSNSGLNTGALIGSVAWVCQVFAKKNRLIYVGVGLMKKPLIKQGVIDG